MWPRRRPRARPLERPLELRELWIVRRRLVVARSPATDDEEKQRSWGAPRAFFRGRRSTVGRTPRRSTRNSAVARDGFGRGRHYGDVQQSQALHSPPADPSAGLPWPELLRAMSDSLVDAIAVVASDGCVAFANRAMRQLLRSVGPIRIKNKRLDGDRSIALKALVHGEVNYGHADFVWTDCGEKNGTPRWGDTTWANGYWYFAWGHMSADLPALFNNVELLANPNSARTFRSDHVGGVQFVFVDGSVRFLDDDSDPHVRRALVTRAGNDSANSPQ